MYACGAIAPWNRILSLYSGRSDDITKRVVVPWQCPTIQTKAKNHDIKQIFNKKFRFSIKNEILLQNHTDIVDFREPGFIEDKINSCWQIVFANFMP